MRRKRCRFSKPVVTCQPLRVVPAVELLLVKEIRSKPPSLTISAASAQATTACTCTRKPPKTMTAEAQVQVGISILSGLYMAVLQAAPLNGTLEISAISRRVRMGVRRVKSVSSSSRWWPIRKFRQESSENPSWFTQCRTTAIRHVIQRVRAPPVVESLVAKLWGGAWCDPKRRRHHDSICTQASRVFMESCSKNDTSS